MQAANPSHAAALVMVDELARNGITDAVLAPGSRSAALAMALHDDPRIRLHVEVDERSAGFLAIGLARASGRPAAAVVTSGTAVANLHPAVVEADLDAVPLLLLTADRPPELQHTGANQTIDQHAIFGTAPRWHVVLGVPEDRATSNALWRSTIARAVAVTLGLGAPAGPVHLDLPFREPTVPASDDGRTSVPGPFGHDLSGRRDRQPWIRIDRAPRRLDPGRVQELAGRMLATQRGLLVAGTVDPPPAPLTALAEATGWPLVAEPTSGARRGDAAIRHAPILLSHERWARGATPDLVLRVGRTGLSRELAGLLGTHVPQLLLTGDGRVPDPERTIGEVLVADVAPALEDLAAAIGLPGGSAWLDRWRAADRAASAAIDARLDADDVPSEPRTARDVAAAVPDGTTLVVASSMPVRDLDRFMAPREGLRILANRGASGIDGFVSTVLGVALARQRATAGSAAVGAGRVDDPVGGPVVALTGDLSLLHDAGGFLLAPDAAAIDAVFVVVDNDGGGIFSFLPQAGYPGSFERVFGTPHGRDLADLARLHRLGYHRVTSAEALPATVADAVVAGGLHLVHVRTGRAENRALHQELTELAHGAIDRLATDVD
ncbi:MAG: 2-succinyl-5-enolpyruvyl-6-hydroxy-3-cyclohexene-1-carboxylic-acid synthase [Nitriliruptoraceae bacterium]|nr:2-succinyl-5-enolpyruvyl-6-hydroxy-3-cyclohexene-1-carboxylic-acid synthase [Nitriliruptoraceae bacterium]